MSTQTTIYYFWVTNRREGERLVTQILRMVTPYTSTFVEYILGYPVEDNFIGETHSIHNKDQVPTTNYVEAKQFVTTNKTT